MTVKEAGRRKLPEDPIVAEVRKAGQEMAYEADDDLHTLCERLRQAERQHPERLVKGALRQKSRSRWNV